MGTKPTPFGSSHTRLGLAILTILVVAIGCKERKTADGSKNPDAAETPMAARDTTIHTLTDSLFTADPSAHVFEGKIYVYPSHDYEAGVPQDDLGSHFAMKDYHVFSMDRVGGPVTDHGVALDIADVPWAGRQMWAPDAAKKGDTYYFYFPVKDQEDVFRIGVATASSPAGPFTAKDTPIAGSFSMDPAVFQDGEDYYMYFGGIWGGQLQRWQGGSYVTEDTYPEDDEPALAPKVARLSDNMVAFAENPKDVVLLDAGGNPLTAGDNERRFFEAAWVHKYGDAYYFSYSTGDTHNIAYAVGDNPYGPFTYKGVVLEPVLGWTNHHSIVEFDGKWWLFFHDSATSGGQTHLRNVKFTELRHRQDGTIETINAFVEAD